ncbi:MAG: hypothetical protein K1W40_20115 [Schaedlerella sp.]|uniref:hypothetical protein n=1 Tax=Schaedlerella sp. TaxID=2676057 RepID=UPI0035275285
MEETIRSECSGSEKYVLKPAAGLCVLMGLALCLNPVSDGTEEKNQNWRNITELEAAGNKVRTGSREGTDPAMYDAEKLVFKTLLLQGSEKNELVLSEKALPEECLILPDISEGNLWEILQPEGSGAASGAGSADWVEPEASIRQETWQDRSGIGPGNLSGAETDPVKPDNLPEAGAEADMFKPEDPSDVGTEADPIRPQDPSDVGTEVDPIRPQDPSGAGTEVDPINPKDPSDVGTEVDPIKPGNPSDVGTEVDPIDPENPGNEGAEGPEQGASGSVENGGAVPDSGNGENGEQGTVSCFVLDEMGMLCGFLPEYAEISDGCLTLPAECTGIRRGAFAGCGAGILELYIPAGAAVIEEGALSGLVSLEWIDVEGGNPGCVSDCGVLFDSTMSVLLAFPAAWMDIYAVPPYVTRIADQAFDGTSIYRLDIRECTGLSFGQNVFGSSGGSGIQVAVRGPELEMYAEMLAGYGVTLTK